MAYEEGIGLKGPPSDPAYAFIPGTDYVEDAFPGETFNFMDGDPMKIGKRYILLEPAKDRLHEFINRLKGWPIVDGGVLYRNIPEVISPLVWTAVDGFKPKYYCTKILKVTPEKPIGPAFTSPTSPPYDPDDIDSFSEQTYDESDADYTQFVIDAMFEQPIYDVYPIEDIDYEWQRNTVLREFPIDSTTDIKSSVQLIVFDGITPQPGVATVPDDTNVGSVIAFPEKKKQVLLDWYDVPANYINWEYLDNTIKKVNTDIFYDYYEAGTLMLNNYSYNRRRHQLGYFVYDVQFQFLHRPYGFNRALNGLFAYQLTRKKIGGGPVFESDDFNALFDS